MISSSDHYYSTAVNPTTCNFCLVRGLDGVEQCNSELSQVPCSYGEFPNIGTTHCYTVVGRIASLDAPEIIHTGIARGCINCTGYHCVVLFCFVFFSLRMEDIRRLFQLTLQDKDLFPIKKVQYFFPDVVQEWTSHMFIVFTNLSLTHLRIYYFRNQNIESEEQSRTRDTFLKD